MAYFVIAGKTDCLNLIHALHVADFLRKHLPNFTYREITKSEEEWPSWLDQTNSMNNWHETTSPVIWKEVRHMGGKPHLIGNLSEFWEYCYDYYGFQTRIPKEDLKNIMTDNQLRAQANLNQKKISIISIIGVSNYEMTKLILYELQHCFTVKDNEMLEVKLYDEIINVDTDEEDFLIDVVDEVRNAIKGRPQSLYLVSSYEEAISNSDLLIIITDYSKSPVEETAAWLTRCRRNMLYLADDINVYAKRSLKVILNHQGPVCFNASVLMEYCTTIKLTNIVAVTADEGISLTWTLSEKIDELVKNFWCPPVWGFSGILSHVSVASTLITTEVVRPFKRSLKIKENSNLPKGEIQLESRFFENLFIVGDSLYSEIEERKKKERRLLIHPPSLPKVRALASLLKLWFAEEISDAIISLGICSNGSYGFPVGVCFSQLVTLNEKRIWEPNTDLPLQPSIVAKITAISLEVEATLKDHGLGQRDSEAMFEDGTLEDESYY